MRTVQIKLKAVRIKSANDPESRRFFQVSFPKIDGKGKYRRWRKTFADREEAEEFFADIKKQNREHGAAAMSISGALRMEAVKCAEILSKVGKSLTEAVNFFVRHINAVTRSVSVSAAVDAFQSAMKDEGASPRYLADLRSRLGRFEEKFGSRSVAEIGPKEIGEWLSGLSKRSGNGEKLGRVSRNTFRRRLVTFFKFCRDKEWCDLVPVPAGKRVREESTQEIRILSPEQCQRLLNVAAIDTLPFWAIHCLAGLRVSEVCRLRWEDVNFKTKIITVSAAISKTSSRRTVDILPTLLRWLKPYQDRQGLVISPVNRRKRLDADRERAGLLTEWPENAGRKSFVSYHYARFQNAAATAAQTGHSQSVLHKYYKALVKDPRDAKRFFQIVPAEKGSPKVIPFSKAA